MKSVLTYYVLAMVSGLLWSAASAEARVHHYYGYGYHRCMALCLIAHPFQGDTCDAFCGIGVPTWDDGLVRTSEGPSNAPEMTEEELREILPDVEEGNLEK